MRLPRNHPERRAAEIEQELRQEKLCLDMDEILVALDRIEDLAAAKEAHRQSLEDLGGIECDVGGVRPVDLGRSERKGNRRRNQDRREDA